MHHPSATVMTGMASPPLANATVGIDSPSLAEPSQGTGAAIVFGVIFVFVFGLLMLLAIMWSIINRQRIRARFREGLDFFKAGLPNAVTEDNARGRVVDPPVVQHRARVTPSLRWKPWNSMQPDIEMGTLPPSVPMKSVPKVFPRPDRGDNDFEDVPLF